MGLDPLERWDNFIGFIGSSLYGVPVGGRGGGGREGQESKPLSPTTRVNWEGKRGQRVINVTEVDVTVFCRRGASSLD